MSDYVLIRKFKDSGEHIFSKLKIKDQGQDKLMIKIYQISPKIINSYGIKSLKILSLRT